VPSAADPAASLAREEEVIGEERLKELLVRSSGRPLDAIVKTVTESVGNWASDPDSQDDTTIVLARRL
jgi:hypothetical protein